MSSLHVRRTDKTTEAIDSHHEIDTYFTLVQNYFEHVQDGENGIENNFRKSPKTVFIASDDHEILGDAQSR